MSQIQRYDLDEIMYSDNGVKYKLFVTYEDHAAEVARLTAALEEALTAIINAGYCPEDESPLLAAYLQSKQTNETGKPNE